MINIVVYIVTDTYQFLVQIRIILSEANGGLGIPENIVTACPECHFEYDFGKQTNQYRIYTENYLKRIYGRNWNKEKLIYKKERVLNE